MSRHLNATLAALALTTAACTTAPTTLPDPPATAQTDAREHLLLGNTRLLAQDPQGAIQAYTHAIKANPDLTDAWVNRGIAWNKAQRFDKAIDDFNAALTLAPNDAEIYYNLGNLYANMGHYEPAIRAYDKALALSPDHPGALNNLANAWAGLQRYPEAIALLEAFTQRWPENPHGWMNLASALEGRHDPGDTDRAEQLYRRALDLAPELELAWYALAELYHHSGRAEQARVHYQRFIEITDDEVLRKKATSRIQHL